jgi:hypothetical protein
MKALILSIAISFSMVGVAYAQSTKKYYNSKGSYTGRSVSSGNTTKYYNKSGSYTGRSVASENSTKYYNRSGSYKGRSVRR